MNDSLQEELERATTVFSGQVLAVERTGGWGWYQNKIHFQVSRYWKGISGHRIAVYTGNGLGDCGVQFVKGKQYLVFANGTMRLTTNVCTPTGLVAQAKYYLAELGPGSPPTLFTTSRLGFTFFALISLWFLWRCVQKKKSTNET